MQHELEEISLSEISEALHGVDAVNSDARFMVRVGDWLFPVLLRLSAEHSEKLLVLFNGAVDRTRSESGIVFQRSSWIGDFRATRLHICDPTPLRFPDMSIGWGQLSREQWGIPLYKHIVDALRQEIGLPGAESTVYYGSSAGGHQALMTACLDRESHAVANNPQTDITNYWPGHQKRLFKKVFKDDSVGTGSLAEFPWRFRCTDLFKKERFVPPLRIFTNINSPRDFELQFLPFAEELPKIQPSSASVLLEPYWDAGGGHRALDRMGTVRKVNEELERVG